MQQLATVNDLEAAVAGLVKAEPRFAAIVACHGLPALRRAEPSLETLLRIVTDQLISLKAGEAIWARLARQLGGFSPPAVLVLREEELRSLGLSRAKARTFHAAAEAFQAGHFAQPQRLSEDELLHRLLALPGVGPWTASIYLLTAHAAADAWPAADLALQVAVKDLLGLHLRPSTAEMTRLAEPWRPWRSAAALLLWRHYRAARGMEPA